MPLVVTMIFHGVLRPAADAADPALYRDTAASRYSATRAFSGSYERRSKPSMTT